MQFKLTSSLSKNKSSERISFGDSGTPAKIIFLGLPLQTWQKNVAHGS